MIACSHPGKIGDSLYSMPAVRALCKKHNCKADFYTSDYCKPMKNLVEFQSYINEFIIPENYKVERMDLGCQPWQMPIDETKYEAVYQMGFQQIPDKAIHQFIAEQVGIIETLKVSYELDQIFYNLPEKYIVIAPRGITSYLDLFQEVASKSPYPVMIIGGAGDGTTFGYDVIDYTGADMLATAYMIKNSVGFVGLMSSQLVLANGFNIPKVAPHDGKSWDMRHVIYSDTNFYPVDPTADEVIKLLGL